MKSMTGYGVATGKVGRGRVHVELKTINHRYLEISFRIPPRMGSLEPPLRDFLQQRLSRGKVDLFLKELEPIFGTPELLLDVELARQYQGAIKRLQQSLKLPIHPDPLSLVGLRDFVRLQEKEGSYLGFWRDVRRLVLKAMGHVEKMRAQEGAYLFQDQKGRLKDLRNHLSKIEAKAKQNAKTRRSVKINQTIGSASENSLAADKMDITEEVTRLKSHAKQYQSLLHSKQAVGRKLDFLIQEMHREMNTIGAKASDSSISHHVVECKALLENLREQIQNIE